MTCTTSFAILSFISNHVTMVNIQNISINRVAILALTNAVTSSNICEFILSNTNIRFAEYANVSAATQETIFVICNWNAL